MRHMRNLVCGGMILLAAAAGARAQSEATTLRGAVDDKLLIGAAVMSYQIEQPRLGALVAAQFNCLTGENEFKVVSLQPEPGQFNFGPADKIIDFAEQHNIKVVGHNLCWHNQIPAWEFADADGNPLPRDKALANLKAHIDTVCRHFRGKVIGWDVVNEAISDSPNEFLRDTPARKAIGDDYIEKAFEFAHEADPDAELYYNDYNDEEPGKREKVLRLVKMLKDKGLRIDGVGIQGHWQMHYPAPSVVDDAIVAFHNAGVKVMISELDIDMIPRRQTGAEVGATEKTGADPYPNGLPANLAEEQGKRYADLFKVFLKHPGYVTRVTFWGTHDGTSWLNDWPVRGRHNHPLLWDRQLNPKPAFFAVLKVLNETFGGHSS